MDFIFAALLQKNDSRTISQSFWWVRIRPLLVQYLIQSTNNKLPTFDLDERKRHSSAAAAVAHREHLILRDALYSYVLLLVHGTTSIPQFDYSFQCLRSSESADRHKTNDGGGRRIRSHLTIIRYIHFKYDSWRAVLFLRRTEIKRSSSSLAVGSVYSQ